MNKVNMFGASIGAFLSFLFGDLDGLLIALIVMVCLDYITGVLGAVATKTVNSNVGFIGILRKLDIFLVVAMAQILDSQVFGIETCRMVVICFYIANEGISIIENSVKIGVPVPEKLVDVLEQLKGDSTNE